MMDMTEYCECLGRRKADDEKRGCEGEQVKSSELEIGAFKEIKYGNFGRFARINCYKYSMEKEFNVFGF